MEAIDLPPERNVAGVEIADRAGDDLVPRGQIEHPLVVLEPRTALHFDWGDDGESRGQCAIARRQRGFVEGCVLLRRPRHTLRACRVEQVNMRVDDALWRGLSHRTDGRQTEKTPTVEHRLSI